MTGAGVAAGPGTTVPSVRASLVDGHVVVSADGPVDIGSAGSIEEGLAAWADGYAASVGVGPIRPAPTGWCSWYHYFTDVTAADVEENVAAIHERDGEEAANGRYDLSPSRIK